MKQSCCHRNAFFIAAISKAITFAVNHAASKIKSCNILSADHITVNFSTSCVSNEVHGPLSVPFTGT